uniref:Zgc:158640 n=1 Tax=Oryzias latipes TaxID=8090 RepID=A0A3P9LY83_ORYLA
MTDSSFSSLDAKVVLASSSDESHPPENIVDGNINTFWMSTGMFPQEFIIRFPEPTTISALTVDIKKLKIEKNISQSASQFESVTEKVQRLLSVLNKYLLNATHLRFIITSGYDHFVSVHKVSIKK